MRVAVIADTHDRMPPDLPPRLVEAEAIWHLGDVCDPAILDELAVLGRPLVVVRGNCDWELGWPLVRTLSCEGWSFHLEHIPPRRVASGTQVVVHGHTHVPRDETDALGVRWLNPGCISHPRANVRSFAWLEITPGSLRWDLVVL